MKLVYRNVRLWLLIFLIAPVILKCRSNVEQKEWDINEGYVPDSTTAIQIAQIIFVRVYGEKVLERKPFIVKLKNGIWVVDGTLEKGMYGGVPHIEIQRSDGKIINLIHGK
ncbi:NTF2 fold immunity protein [Pedobacter kyungheensis]|uniref:NTF2 fold immunity protein n=1 Tax=Pedobacter kyungheensis TaxID=1069985 RepID=UPI00068A7CEF|nr:NTF2 fold immunity protein [Pedobacter kyungheensis]